ISFAGLAMAATGFGLVYLCNRIGVRHIAVYVALAVGIWLAFHKAGVHPTVAGVILGLMTPATARVDGRGLRAAIDQLPRNSDGNSDNAESHHEHQRQLSLAARETIPPLYRLEEALHPWVAFGIMPLFALANAGVRFESAAVTSSVAMAVAVGLVLGK